MQKIRTIGLVGCLLWALTGCRPSVPDGRDLATVFRDVTLIDGNGAQPRAHVDLVIQGDSILSIGETGKDSLPPGARILDERGKVVIPELINCHGHLGLLKGTTMSSGNYTRDNVLRQLVRYEHYGVGAVLSLGTDHQEIFAWRDSSHAGLLPGATIYTAGFGFGVPGGAPPPSFGMDKVYRPTTAEAATEDVRRLAPLKPDLVKLWLDDFGGKMPEMKPEVYAAVIAEAHRQGLRVAAHVFHIRDARRLVALGIDVLAHSVRDSLIDDSLLAAMKAGGVTYIPTLSLDEFQFVYVDSPAWLNEPFFKGSLEPGVWDTVTSQAYLDRLRKDPGLPAKRATLGIALQNLKRVYDAGIPVVLGTDSGAQPIRAQGFSEHRELQLLVKAGLTPLEALTVATRNGARLLRIDTQRGTLEPGKRADFVLLSGDPSVDISQTESIVSVWQNGVRLGE